MDTVIIIEIAIGIIVLGAAVLFVVWDARRRRRIHLQQRFGPEYERQMRARGSERDAAWHLSAIVDRRDRLDIRPLEPAARERYLRRWEAVQTDFVDRPGPTLDEADRLVMDVMHERGYPVYPVGDFDERTELIAADHPQAVQHYRAAHTARQGHHRHPNLSDTEHLRQAFMHYRVLFDELVRGGTPVTAPVSSRRGRHHRPRTPRMRRHVEHDQRRSRMDIRPEQYEEHEPRGPDSGGSGSR
jgi:hypothetical protein